MTLSADPTACCDRKFPALHSIVVGLLLLCVATPASALTTSDQPSSMLTYPYIVADVGRGVDTNLRLTNTANVANIVRCFYENHTRHCESDMSACDDDHPCGAEIQCVPGFRATEFVVQLEPQQPIAWQLGTGLASVPGNGSGTVPPVPEQPFVGVLRCVEIDGSGVKFGRNALVGSATVENHSAADQVDAFRYNAVGLQAFPDAPATPDSLILGGLNPEYEGCNNAHVLTHSFDGVRSPANLDRTVETTLVIVPCTADLRTGVPGAATLRYTSFNEFDQRIVDGTFTVSGQRVTTLRGIDTVLTAASAGTVTGETRLTRDAGGGVMMLAIESHRSASPELSAKSASINVPGMGDTEAGDVVLLPPFGTPSTPTITPTPSRTGTPTTTPLPPDIYEPDNRPTQARPIACGDAQARSNHVRSDEDWASLTLTEPSAVVIQAIGPRLSLWTTDGDLLSDPDLARIDVACGDQQLSAGTYHIKATGPALTVIPSYVLSVQCVSCVSPTVTPTTTVTPTISSTPTEAATVTATPTPCAGDCDGDGAVSVAELVRGVNILLGSLRVSRCVALDFGHDGRVSVDELVKAVNGALKGCDTASSGREVTAVH